MIAYTYDLRRSRSRTLQRQHTSAAHGWSLEIINFGRDTVKFILWHNDWPRGVEVTAATLHNRRRLELCILEQTLTWPDRMRLDQLLGYQGQFDWVPGVIGKLLDEARQRFRREGGK